MIRGVVGPDEYHDAYPDSERPGIDNNAYTNAMAAWVLWRVQDVLDALPEQRRDELSHMLALGRDELDRWDEMSRKLLLPFHDDGILSQFEGYEQLEELDWQGYQSEVREHPAARPDPGGRRATARTGTRPPSRPTC